MNSSQIWSACAYLLNWFHQESRGETMSTTRWCVVPIVKVGKCWLQQLWIWSNLVKLRPFVPCRQLQNEIMFTTTSYQQSECDGWSSTVIDVIVMLNIHHPFQKEPVFYSNINLFQDHQEKLKKRKVWTIAEVVLTSLKIVEPHLPSSQWHIPCQINGNSRIQQIGGT